MIDYYSKPILTARETARYLGMPDSTLDVWLLDSGKPPLVHAVQPERGHLLGWGNARAGSNSASSANPRGPHISG